MVFEFLYQKIRIFKAYFKRDFDEDTLRNNMTLILELMDGELCWWCRRGLFFFFHLELSSFEQNHQRQLNTVCFALCPRLCALLVR